MSHSRTEHVRLLYSEARIRGLKITRADERRLAVVVLDAEHAEQLGVENQCWLVAKHPGFERLVQQLLRLDTREKGGLWIVVAYSRDQVAELRSLWNGTARPIRGIEHCWKGRTFIVSPPEQLKPLWKRLKDDERYVAGVMLIDPYCSLYRARSFIGADGRHVWHDRPQFIVNFRADCSIHDWKPPLLIITQQAANSIDTNTLGRVLGLDGFLYIDSSVFACWDRAITSDDY